MKYSNGEAFCDLPTKAGHTVSTVEKRNTTKLLLTRVARPHRGVVVKGWLWVAVVLVGLSPDGSSRAILYERVRKELSRSHG